MDDFIWSKREKQEMKEFVERMETSTDVITFKNVEEFINAL